MAGIRKIKWEYVILILIILLGFGVRYYGVHADYGFDGNDAPFFATFGLRVASLNNPIQTFAELMNFRWGAVTPVILALNLIILKVLNITITEKLITLPIVLIGTLTIFVIYLLGKELKNKYVGLMSALFLAILPLFFTPDKRMKKEVISIKSVLTAQPKKRMFIYQAEGVLNLVGGVFWPVFIYLAVKNVVTLGAIVSMTSLLLVVFIVYIGGLVDKNVKKTLKRGVFLNAPFWIIRLLFLSPVGLFINNFLGAVTSSMVNISLSKLIYGHAEKTKRIGSFFLFRELHLGLGRVLILVLALFIPGLLWMFVVAFLVQFVHLSAVNW